VPIVNDFPLDSAAVLGSECLFLRHHLFEMKDPIDVAEALIVVAL
jgi:hypothetical protein